MHAARSLTERRPRAQRLYFNGGPGPDIDCCCRNKTEFRVAGTAVYRVGVERNAGNDAVQHPDHPADIHGRRVVHRVVHSVHSAVLRAAHDRHHRAVRADWAPTPAHRPA